MGAQPKIAFSEKKYAGMKLIMRSLIVCFSYHHNNTLKFAEAMSRILDAQTKTPEEANSDEIQQCDLIGFGSGVDSDKHYQVLLDFADKLPQIKDKKAFIFSTAALAGEDKLAKDHSTLREILQSKGCKIVGEFQCKGFNTNGFLRFFGGMNKGRPNSEDIKRAEGFAHNLKQNLESNLEDLKHLMAKD